jgi:glycosyltransferase involved in cell wall biosynthesis
LRYVSATRILIVASFLPYPPDSGARIRTWEIARRLKRDHEIVFGVHVRREEDLARVEELRRQGFGVVTGRVNRGWRAACAVVRELVSGGPPLFALRRSHELETRLAKMHAEEPFDAIQVEHFELARYAGLIGGGGARAMVLHDVLSVAYARMARIERSVFWKMWRGYNAWRLRAYEKKLLREYGACIVMSEKDAAAIADCVEAGRVHVFPNSVDCGAKRFLEEAGEGAPALLFVGLLMYPPNADAARWAMEEILPRVRERVPECRLWVVGDGASEELRELARARGAELAGRVEDVEPYYARCTVAVAPLRAGGGTRLKILEAMAFGRAVVATPLGCEGLKVRDGEELLVAETSEEFARAVVRLLLDREERERLRWNARRLVEEAYDWDECARAHVSMYEKSMGVRRQNSMGGDASGPFAER